MKTVWLNDGEIWCPRNGEGERQIGKVWCAGVTDKFPMGTEVLTWARSLGDTGYCTARAFRRWIKHTEATKVSQPLFTCSKCGVSWRGGITNGQGLCGSCDDTL